MCKQKSKESKVLTLKDHGSLHPHPEQVKDHLFGKDQFFDSRDIIQVKYEMLRRARLGEVSASQAADEAGFSRPTFYEAKSAFDQSGLTGLLPAQKGPRRAHKLDDVVMSFVEQELAKHPRLNMEDIGKQIFENFGLRVHARSIRRAIMRRKKKSQ